MDIHPFSSTMCLVMYCQLGEGKVVPVTSLLITPSIHAGNKYACTPSTTTLVTPRHTYTHVELTRSTVRNNNSVPSSVINNDNPKLQSTACNYLKRYASTDGSGSGTKNK